MISETDKKIIRQYAKKYNVSSIILFGSSLEKNKKANDIDLGVKGIEPRLFFKFYTAVDRGDDREPSISIVLPRTKQRRGIGMIEIVLSNYGIIHIEQLAG